MKLYLLSVLILSMLLMSCATQQVSYEKDISPILKSRCLDCHISPNGEGYKASGLAMDSYEALMQGAFYGPVIFPGDSRRSTLNLLVEGRAGTSQRMPHDKKTGLNNEEVQILRDWVNQGALDN